MQLADPIGTGADTLSTNQQAGKEPAADVCAAHAADGLGYSSVSHLHFTVLLVCQHSIYALFNDAIHVIRRKPNLWLCSANVQRFSHTLGPHKQLLLLLLLCYCIADVLCLCSKPGSPHQHLQHLPCSSLHAQSREPRNADHKHHCKAR